MSPNRPWERLPSEGDQPFAYFEVYRKMGPERSVSAVAKQVGRAPATIKRHCRVYKWTGRAAAWDAHVSQAQDAATLDELEKLRREQVQRLGELNKLCYEALKTRLEGKSAKAPKDTCDGGELSDGVLSRLFLDTIRLQRLVVGQSTESVDVQEKKDLSKYLTAAQIAQLRTMKRRVDGEPSN